MRSAHAAGLKCGGLLLLLACTAGSGQALANVGRVEFVIGDVAAVSAAGQRRALVMGEQLSNGDTIFTNAGRAQIRFPDGAYVSLQPNTEFGIKDYHYDGKTDGSERGFFSLLKGALRAVTGLIGHAHRGTFQITTPTATVGIRGTGGLIQVLNDQSTLINGSSGIWTLKTPAGYVEVPAGTSAMAPADPSIPPYQTSQGPDLPPPPPPGGLNNDYRQGDQVDPDGRPTSLTTSTLTTTGTATTTSTSDLLKSGSGYAAAVAYGDGETSWGYVSTGSDATAVFDDAGQLRHLNFKDQLSSVQTVFNLKPDGTQIKNESGNDGIIAWGRWTGGVNITYPCREGGTCTAQPTYADDQGLHYVVGLPTPTLPTTGSARYDLLGATQPTYVDGHTAPGSFGGSLLVNFGPTTTVGMDLTVTMPDGSYSIVGQGATTSGSLFAANSSTLTTTGLTGNACKSDGCSSSVSGFFAGSSAQRVGLSYNVVDYGTGTIVGAAAFKKNP